MAELDKYRPPDYDNPTGPYSRWAFHTEPQFEQRGGSWTAWYPGTDWSVTASSKQEAITQLRTESIHREDKHVSHEAIAARHLQEPIPGIYAMDIGLYNQLRETETAADITRAFGEAERARVAGQTYTRDDYFRNGRGHQP